jgi:nucleotide-binding universal stress UspA family protein
MSSGIIFKRILVPYDESRPSKDALNKAVELIKAIEGSKNRPKLIILHVVPNVYVPPLFNRVVRNRSGKLLTMSEYFQEIYHELRDKAKEKLRHVEERCEEEGVNTEVHVVSGGNPAARIVEFAKKEDVDLIVIGSRYASSVSNTGKGHDKKIGYGRNIIKKIGLGDLGSVSRAVTEKSPCPVLLVRP